MSEKRTKFHYTFLKTFNIASIYEDDMIICKDMLIEEETLDKIIDLLNELVTKCHRLEKENDRLRQQLKTKVIVNKQYEEKERFKKENRVLKKDLNKLYNLLIDKGMSHKELQDVLMVIDDE